MKIPVIRGKIGNWIYYSGVMTFAQISEKVTASISEAYEASCLDELLQRELTDNYESIRKYILKDNERFFNAVILAIFNGNPQWLEVEFGEEESEYTNVGFLEFSGDETVFPVDGQHRVAGIKAAILEEPKLATEQVPVIFIAHSNTDKGKKKTRKLFSTLNRRAKPVGQNENIALDEDDVCSILTRELVQEFPLCTKDNIINSLGKQIPNSNEVAFTSLITLYQCVELLVKHNLAIEGIKGRKFKEYQLYRPNDEAIEKLRKYVFSVFESFVKKTEPIKEYAESTDGKRASKYRNSSGGNLLFRPVALTEYFEAALILVDKGAVTYDKAFELLNAVELDISQKPWKGLMWDGTKIINRVSKTVIRLLLVFMADNAVLSPKEIDKLVADYGSSLNLGESDARIILDSLVGQP